jgi:hypothetical protein
VGIPVRRAQYHGVVSRIALVIFFAALSVAGCSSAPRAASPTAEIDTIQSTREAGVDKISQSQLQAMVMSMADSYLLTVGEALTLVELDAETPDDRWGVHTLKRTTGAAVLGVAAEPSPEAALLDLLVLSSLEVEAISNRIDHPKGSDLMREHGPALLEQARRAEAALWRDAGRVLTAEQQEELRSLVDMWIEEHPGSLTGVYVRFSDFADLHDSGSAAKARGLLVEVTEATRAVDAARLLGERALWLSTRMPFLVGWQVEETLYDLAVQPEIRRLLDDSTRFTDETSRLVQEVHDVPAEIAQQREALVRDLTALQEKTVADVMAGVTAQREALIADLDQREQELRGLIAEAHELVQSTDTMLGSADTVLSRFRRAPGDTREPLDVTKVRDAARETAAAADRLNELLVTTQEVLASPGWHDRSGDLAQAMDRVEAGGTRWIAHSFLGGLLLIAAGLVALIIYKWVAVKVIGR